MAIDASIALGVKPVQLESPLNQMSNVYALQNAAQSNQLNQMKMDEYKRGVAQSERVRNYLATAKPDDPDFVNNLVAIDPELAMKYQTHTANLAESQAKAKNLGLAGQETQSKLLKSALEQSQAALTNIRTPDQFLAWHEANHTHPIIGPYLSSMGVTKDSARANIEEAMARPGGFQELLQKSALGLAKFTELNKPNIQTQNLNDKSVVSAYPGLGGAPTILSTTPMGISPNTTATINAAAEQGRLNRAAKLKSEIDSGTSDLTPETLDFTAQMYMQTGQMPPLGFGSKAARLREKVLDRAAYLSMHPTGAPTGAPATVSAAEAAGNVNQNKQNVAVAVKTQKDFSTGVQGQMTTSFNTALNHLDTIERLGKDLNNSDVNVVNKASNLFAKELGVAAPTNFAAAKNIVGAEIQKAIVRAGGTGAEREEAAAAFNAANSPAQLAGVIKSYKELLGGQLVSLKQQYESNAGSTAKPFVNKLNSAARKQVEALTTKSTMPAASVGAPIYATNGSSRIMSTDGGVTWTPVK
jgi:hypothetical protein